MKKPAAAGLDAVGQALLQQAQAAVKNGEFSAANALLGSGEALLPEIAAIAQLRAKLPELEATWSAEQAAEQAAKVEQDAAANAAKLAEEKAAAEREAQSIAAQEKASDEAGRGMQAVFWDFDRDGDDDLYVANDASYDVLMRNDGGRFKDISFAAGMDDPRGGMGLAVGDVELDGDEDLFLTHWELELNALYINNLVAHQSQKHHVAAFRDSIVPAGLAPSSATVTSWGAEFFDAENDGDLDLFIANGYTSPDYESTGICIGPAPPDGRLRRHPACR